MTDKKYQYSEVFNSVQGEGMYTGHPSGWVRFFMCNLQCDGFGQTCPTDPATYDLPYQEIDISSITRVEDLPVFDKGCDSSYTWSKKYKHLMKSSTPAEIAEAVRDSMRTDTNPEGLFLHPNSGQSSHLCITGGEPLLKNTQGACVGMLKHYADTRNRPESVTIETNGTQPLTDEFKSYFGNRGCFWGELFFSVSPKLFTVSGEPAKRAIKPEVVKQ